MTEISKAEELVRFIGARRALDVARAMPGMLVYADYELPRYDWVGLCIEDAEEEEGKEAYSANLIGDEVVVRLYPGDRRKAFPFTWEFVHELFEELERWIG